MNLQPEAVSPTGADVLAELKTGTGAAHEALEWALNLEGNASTHAFYAAPLER